MLANGVRERVLTRLKTVVQNEPDLGTMANQIDAWLRGVFRPREERIYNR